MLLLHSSLASKTRERGCLALFLMLLSALHVQTLQTLNHKRHNLQVANPKPGGAPIGGLGQAPSGGAIVLTAESLGS